MNGELIVGIMFVLVGGVAWIFSKKSYTPTSKEEFDRMWHQWNIHGSFEDENGCLQDDVDGLIYRWEVLNGKRPADSADLAQVTKEPEDELEPLVFQTGNFDGSGY